MVFPSVPFYLDPPNWNQQPSHQPAIGGVSRGGGDAAQLPPAVQSRPEGAMAGSVKPGSMADRARLAKAPQPEPGLKCPRCESTNTKFCYFNNYSLSQPRHFCKTCRRYWTRGGALRNVPVGGGCRRNKRSKSSSSGSSKSSSVSTDRHACAFSSSLTSAAASGGGAIHSNVAPPQPQLPLMTSLHPIADYAAAANIGLSFGGVQPMDAVNFHVGSSSGHGLEQWRLQQLQQFPFLGGLEPPPAPPSMGLFPFDGQGVVDDGGSGAFAGRVQGKPSAPGLNAHLSSVKMEQRPERLSLPRQYLGIPRSNDYWGGGGGGGSASGGDGGSASGGWTDLSGFNSASGSSIL